LESQCWKTRSLYFVVFLYYPHAYVELTPCSIFLWSW